MPFAADSLESLLGELSLDDIYKKGELVLSVDDGLKFVELCEDQNWAILGLEGGIARDGGFAPDSELIHDFSLSPSSDWSRFREECNRRAKSVLESNRLEPDILFYVTFVDKKDYESLGREQ